jgi:hypothetical protein
MELTRTRRLFDKGRFAEFHENPASCLIFDARPDGRS